mgnify:FL=1
MSELLLETRELTKAYGRQRAVDRVSVHIQKGAIYGLIGRNGAGKTTFLKMISGLAKPDSGALALFGYQGQELSKIRQRVGCLIEGPGLYPHLSAEDNLNLKCMFMGIHKKGYVAELLSMMGLYEARRKKAGKFSLGMKQRLGIALALVGQPDLLVLDEPINGLDPQGIAEVRETLIKLNEDHRITMIISSHILEELSKISTHYGIIDHGCLLQEISREELMKQCGERIEMAAEAPERMLPLLDSMGFHDYQMIDGEKLYIYERLEDAPLVNQMLVQHGIFVKSVSVTRGDLENYFIRMTGGGKQ